MDSWADWLISLVRPVITRAVAALGMGVATYTGADTAISGAYDLAKGAFAGMTGDVLQLVAMGGFFEAMAISSGGIVSGLAWLALKRWIVTSAPTPA